MWKSNTGKLTIVLTQILIILIKITMELCFYVDYLARKILVGYEFSGKYFMEFIPYKS